MEGIYRMVRSFAFYLFIDNFIFIFFKTYNACDIKSQYFY